MLEINEDYNEVLHSFFLVTYASFDEAQTDWFVILITDPPSPIGII